MTVTILAFADLHNALIILISPIKIDNYCECFTTIVKGGGRKEQKAVDFKKKDVDERAHSKEPQCSPIP